MSASPSQVAGPGRSGWRPPFAALLIIAAAFALGLALFGVLWMQQRGQAEVSRPSTAPADGTVFAPLPTPMPAGVEDSASGLPEPDENAVAERPRIIERTPAPVPAPAPPPTANAAAMDASDPVPLSSPAPRYPPSALRRRETGTVRVLVDVGPDGVPTSTSIVESSQSRDLDRAAVDAVRRWRFRPAQAGGHPTVGSVVVPISFQL